MTTCQFITDAYLTFLGNIYLCHLQNARRQFIADSDSKLTTLQLCVHLLILTDKVHDDLLNHLVVVYITRPSVRLDALIVKAAQYSSSKLTTLGDDLSIAIVLNALRGLTLSQHKQFVNKDVSKVIDLCFILFVELGKYHLILFLCLTCLHGTGEETLVNNYSAQRRISLER